jgi:outer membrane immunogenic protein
MIKSAVVAGALASFVAASAMAADLPVKAQVKAPVAIAPWTGFYGGLNVGYGWGTSSANTTASGSGILGNADFDPASGPQQASNALAGVALANVGLTDMRQQGFIGGVQFGYNYQLPSKVVLGVEADIQASRIRGNGSRIGSATNVYDLTPESFGLGPDTVFNTTGSNVVSASMRWMGTVRGRVGYTYTPTMLLYGTGGLAFGGVSASAFHASQTQVVGFEEGVFENIEGNAQASPGAGSINKTLFGWTAGAGFEWMFKPKWSLKMEALYYDLGSVTTVSTSMVTNMLVFDGFSFKGQAIGIPATTVRFDGVIARVGLNYHLN